MPIPGYILVTIKGNLFCFAFWLFPESLSITLPLKSRCSDVPVIIVTKVISSGLQLALIWSPLSPLMLMADGYVPTTVYCCLVEFPEDNLLFHSSYLLQEFELSYPKDVSEDYVM